MKCGTTSLYDYLIQHPQIAAGKTKEPEYFSKNMGEAKWKNTASYLELFNIQSQHQFTLEASTGYTKFPTEKGVPQRIKDYGLDPYFIYIVRNPFERIRSHYNFMQRDISWKHAIDSSYLLDISMYYKQLMEFKKVFPNKDILVLDFKNLTENPVAICTAVFNFINALPFTVSNALPNAKNETKDTNAVKAQLRAATSGIKKYTPEILKRAVSGGLDLFLKPAEQVNLSPQQQETIYNALKEDMRLLHKEFGVDVQQWGF